MGETRDQQKSEKANIGRPVLPTMPLRPKHLINDAYSHQPETLRDRKRQRDEDDRRFGEV